MADKSKTSFGLDQVSNKTPEWANWIFRAYFFISKALIGWVAAVGLFPERKQFIIVTTINLLADPIMYGFSKLFGIVPEPIDPEKSLLADKQVDDKGNVNTIVPVEVDSAADAASGPEHPQAQVQSLKDFEAE